MSAFRHKKHLGQHFLKDANIARKVAEALTGHGDYKTLLEIGPGLGALTRHLFEVPDRDLWCIEPDPEAVATLQEAFPQLKDHILNGDFLTQDLGRFGTFGVIGNFPYNISSQILFRVYEHRQQVPELVGMFQKEVAERVASPPGSKIYGKTSVLLQAFYDVEYLFTVPPHVFAPPPKVRSAVIRLRRNEIDRLPCDEKLFFQVVKHGFERRRKTLRNALRPVLPAGVTTDDELFGKRAEQLGVAEFIRVVDLMSHP